MDQSFYFPPTAFQHPPPPQQQPLNPSAPFTTNPTYPTPAPIPVSPPHPPYEHMIVSAIEALKEKNGSSRQAIAKYIDRVYTNLPPTHSAMLTNHLKRMKNAGVLVMDKYSYMLPGSQFTSLPNAAVTAAVPAVPVAAVVAPPPQFTLTTPVVVSEQVHTDAVFGQAPDLNGPGKETSSVVKRGRGRPPKVRLDADGNVTVKKSVGRPSEPESQTMSIGKRRGRPRKAVAESAAFTLPSQKPGRLTKIGVAGRKLMKIAGRPVGRPKINKDSTAFGPVEPKWMVDCNHARVKLQHFQTRMQQAIATLKPHVSAESSGDLRVAAAFQELDQLSSVDIMAATFTDGEDAEPTQEPEQMQGDNQIPPPQAQPDQQQYYHGGEHVL